MKKLLTTLFIFGIAFQLFGWFDPSDSEFPSKYGKVMITRVNTFETWPKDVDVFSVTNSIANVPFYDAGDIHADITMNFGGSSNNTFACAWPITIYVYFQTNAPAMNYGYASARLQYYQGNEANDKDGWHDIGIITSFEGVVGVEGGHFGLVTWYPPETNNVHYLVRVWANLINGMESASPLANFIDKNGSMTGYESDGWDDSEVVLIKSIPIQKPGSRRTALKDSLYIELIPPLKSDIAAMEGVKPLMINSANNMPQTALIEPFEEDAEKELEKTVGKKNIYLYIIVAIALVAVVALGKRFMKD